MEYTTLKTLEGKVHHRTDHEGPGGEKRNSPTRPSTSALDGMGVQQGHTPAALPPGNRAGTHNKVAGWEPQSVWTGTENLASSDVALMGATRMQTCFWWGKLK
jgi:hypothetical protein